MAEPVGPKAPMAIAPKAAPKVDPKVELEKELAINTMELQDLYMKWMNASVTVGLPLPLAPGKKAPEEIMSDIIIEIPKLISKNSELRKKIDPKDPKANKVKFSAAGIKLFQDNLIRVNKKLETISTWLSAPDLDPGRASFLINEQKVALSLQGILMQAISNHDFGK